MAEQEFSEERWKAEDMTAEERFEKHDRRFAGALYDIERKKKAAEGGQAEGSHKREERSPGHNA